MNLKDEFVVLVLILDNVFSVLEYLSLLRISEEFV